MLALTLIQPWGGLIATGVKLVENRTWKPAASMIGQRFAIHAGAKLDKETIDDLLDEGLTEHELWRMTRAAIAVATLDRVVADGGHGRESPMTLTRDEARFYSGPVGFVLRDVRPLETPVPCKGALGFWTLSSEVEARVLAQLGETR